MGKKVLVIGPGYIGDILFTTPALHAVKAVLPDAAVTYFTQKKVYSLSVFRGNPDVDEVIVYDKRGVHFTPWGKAALIGRLRRRNFDIAFVFSRGLMRGLIPWFCDIPERVGYLTPVRRRAAFLFTCSVPEPDPATLHRVAYYQNLVTLHFGRRIQVSGYTVPVAPEARRFAEELLGSFAVRRPLVCFHPGARERNRWPVEYVGELGRMIRSRYPAGGIVLTGSPGERVLAERAAGMIGGGTLVLAGRTDFSQVCAVIGRCDAMVTGDTGPLHVACGLNVPVVALFAGSSPAIFGPFGAGRSVVLEATSMGDILPEQAMNALVQLLT